MPHMSITLRHGVKSVNLGLWRKNSLAGAVDGGLPGEGGLNGRLGQESYLCLSRGMVFVDFRAPGRVLYWGYGEKGQRTGVGIGVSAFVEVFVSIPVWALHRDVESEIPL